MSQKTLVTGAPGWLASRLVEALIGKVPELTKYSKKGERPVRALVLPGLDASALQAYGVEVVRGDVRNTESLHAACEGVDTVFHCVGLIHPKRLQDLYAVNTEGTKNALEAAIQAGVKKFVFISSNSPAGCNKRRHVPMRETDPLNPYKAYGKSKALAEAAVQQAFTDKKLDTTILRPCWFYGPNQPARQTRFFRMIKSGKPIVFGDGNNLRSMSYVDNTIQGMLLAEGAPEASGQIYWIADERAYSTLQIYETIADLLGVTLTPRFIPGIASTICEYIDDALQAMNLYSTDFHVAGEMDKDIACSIEKAKTELGYAPTVDLREGMRRSIEWCTTQGISI